MEMTTTGRMIGVLLILLMLFAGAYFVFRLDDCPVNNNVSLEQYQNNRPVLSNRFIIDDNGKAIASLLVPLWLGWFASANADPGIKLKDYEIHNINVRPWKDDRFLALVTFSVKPVKCSYEEWLTGNGDESGDWVRNKSLFFTVVKDGDVYKVDSVGSSP